MYLHYVQRGSGAPLLLVHGIGDSHLMWSPVLGRLARDHECFAIDVPGFGRSAPLEGTPTIERLAGACHAFMAGRGHERYHVAGDSMGGAIALELARAGHCLSATALSPSGFSEGWETVYSKLSLHATRTLTARLVPFAATLTRSALARRLIAGQMVRRGDRYRPHELAATVVAAGTAPSFATALPHVAGHHFPAAELPCPVTVAWGTHDYLLPYGRQAPRARRRLPGARHVTLAGCGHIPTWDDPEQVAATILATTAPASPPARATAADA